jgi:hypothetical protein
MGCLPLWTRPVRITFELLLPDPLLDPELEPEEPVPELEPDPVLEPEPVVEPDPVLPPPPGDTPPAPQPARTRLAPRANAKAILREET